MGYRHPREGEGPGATSAALAALDSRFRGNDEKGVTYLSFEFISGQSL
jgi:hypothetical protein